MKILVAGPDVGMEFGWFLMRWQAKLRYMAQFYDKVYIITSPDRMPFVEDFAQPYTEMEKDLNQDMWRFRGHDIYYLQPNKETCCSVGCRLRHGLGTCWGCSWTC